MGDLVAVLQVGGRLAQFGTPDEILANPASEFVARFVGADRGLKRLSLVRVRDVELQPARTVRLRDGVEMVRREAGSGSDPYVLLVDDGDRPIGWIDGRRLDADKELTADSAESLSPLFDAHTTLKDALSMLLEAGVQTGIVVNAAGAVDGLVTVDMILDRTRSR
jgi:osmoprotectant transport system ATP-binding protein